MPSNDLIDFVHTSSLHARTNGVNTRGQDRRQNLGMDTLGKRLKIARKAMGMTIQQLAKKSGCSKQMISALELGTREEVKATLFFAICDALQAAPRWLLSGVGTQRLAGALSDTERDLVYILRSLPQPLQDHLMSVAEGLAISMKIHSPVTPFVVPPPKKTRNL